MNMPWPNFLYHLHLYTADAGHLGPTDAVVIEFTTPAVLGNDMFGSFSWSDIGGDQPAWRDIVLSTQPGDFTVGLGTNGSVINGVANGSLYFSLGPNGYNMPALTLPNTKYYLNIKNYTGACTNAHCDLDIEFTPPR